MQEAFYFPRDRGAARRWALITWLGLSVIFAISALWRPSDDGIILCPFRALTGHPCPGCGMTRAFSAIAHGDLWQAVLYNPFSPLLFLTAILVWTSASATLLNLEGVRATIARLRPSTAVANALLLLVMVWWIVRLAGGF
jgi:hypothetical protein